MATQDDKQPDEDSKPCAPVTDGTIVPPGELTSIVAGAGVGFAFGLALGALLGLRIGGK